MREARSLVADFALPLDAAWQKTLQSWLQRARPLGWVEVITSLETDIQKIPSSSNQSITILEQFRIHHSTPE